MEGKSLLNLAMRISQFFWALLVLAIAGNMVHQSGSHTASIVNYSVFCAAFAMLALLFLIPATIKEAWSVMPALPFALDLLNTLFWFCGAVAFAAKLGVHSCGNAAYLKDNHIINEVSKDRSGRCHEAQATTAFLWFGFAAFLVSTALTGLGMTGGSGMGGRGGIRRGPAMSQV